MLQRGLSLGKRAIIPFLCSWQKFTGVFLLYHCSFAPWISACHATWPEKGQGSFILGISLFWKEHFWTQTYGGISFFGSKSELPLLLCSFLCMWKWVPAIFLCSIPIVFWDAIQVIFTTIWKTDFISKMLRGLNNYFGYSDFFKSCVLQRWRQKCCYVPYLSQG